MIIELWGDDVERWHRDAKYRTRWAARAYDIFAEDDSIEDVHIVIGGRSIEDPKTILAGWDRDSLPMRPDPDQCGSVEE